MEGRAWWQEPEAGLSCVCAQEAESEWEVGLGFCKKCHCSPCDPLSLSVLSFLKVLQPSQNSATIGDQVFKHGNPWGTFRSQTEMEREKDK